MPCSCGGKLKRGSGYARCAECGKMYKWNLTFDRYDENSLPPEAKESIERMEKDRKDRLAAEEEKRFEEASPGLRMKLLKEKEAKDNDR